MGSIADGGASRCEKVGQEPAGPHIVDGEEHKEAMSISSDEAGGEIEGLQGGIVIFSLIHGNHSK